MGLGVVAQLHDPQAILVEGVDHIQVLAQGEGVLAEEEARLLVFPLGPDDVVGLGGLDEPVTKAVELGLALPHGLDEVV